MGIAFFTNVENTFEFVKIGLQFSFGSLIPSIFFPMIFFSFILYTKAFEGVFERLPNKAVSFLGICRKYFLYVLLSSMCGFLTGPKLICEDYDKNGGDDDEFSNAIILSSNAGLGFLISFLGNKIWGNIWFGIYLFLIQILTSLLLGKLLFLKKNSSENFNNQSLNSDKISIQNSLVKAISSTSYTMISVCGFVTFFTVICEILATNLRFEKGSFLYSLIYVICEFSKGTSLALSVDNLFLASFLTGFCIGFGGICVHFQTFAICENHPLNKKMFVLFKICHGLICGFLSFLFVFTTKIEPRKNAFLIESDTKTSAFYCILLIVLFVSSIIFHIIRKKFRNNIDF